MVPVVHGPTEKATYLQAAPSSSFIFVGDFENLKQLAEYLIMLDQNEEEYLKYFNWKRDYVVDNVVYFQTAWCSLCTKLYEQQDSGRKLIPSVHSWWFGSSKSTFKRNKFCKKVA